MTYDATELAEFIEMRSDLCDGDVLLKGVMNLSSCLIENPGNVMWVFLPIVNTHYRFTVNTYSRLIVNTFT